MKRCLCRVTPAVALVCLFSVPARAEEGLWLYNKFPKDAVARKYGFKVTDAFLDHLRLSSVRFNSGGSGSFVSPEGLLFTNHHVGLDCVHKVSTAEHDYVANGFYAATQAEEKACPDLEVNVLTGIEDVTAEVRKAAGSAAPAEANQLRKASIAKIEKECNAATGNRCDVVTLYSGGQYHLYQYKKYTDVRLVFTPEYAIGQFGGDPDNFTYPRYGLDFALFRAYENGKPAHPAQYLKWSADGAKDGELTFTSGHPGTTGRLATVTELEFSRDVSYPLLYERLESAIKAVEAYGAGSAENARAGMEVLFGLQNSFKAYTGFIGGLRDKALMDRKRQEEADLRKRVDADPRMSKEYGNTWRDVDAAYDEFRTFYTPFFLYERGATLGSDLLRIARHVVRLSEERTKPNGQRLREYTDAALPSLEQSICSEAPIADSLEEAVLANYFEFLVKHAGAQDPTVAKVLAGRTPRQAAEFYVSTSKLKDIAVRKQLASDTAAVKASEDGMIRLARILDEPARKLRKRYEDSFESRINASAGKIGQARFAVYGASAYPDATFTLRLTYAPVKGYTNQAGQRVPWATTFDGLYRRSTGTDPYRLPESWLKAKRAVKLDTPFNFITTADTHGGNSGSPTVNTKGEIVGILFDGNLEGLPNKFVYTDAQARSVHVASQGIVEALRDVYHADRVLKEIGR